MGAILNYKCTKCDFKADDLALGLRFAAMLYAFMCTGCKLVFSKPVDGEENVVERFRTCHICGGTEWVRWNGKTFHAFCKDVRRVQHWF